MRRHFVATTLAGFVLLSVVSAFKAPVHAQIGPAKPPSGGTTTITAGTTATSGCTDTSGLWSTSNIVRCDGTIKVVSGASGGTGDAFSVTNGTSTGKVAAFYDNTLLRFGQFDGQTFFAGNTKATATTNIGALAVISHDLTGATAFATGTTVADTTLALGTGAYGADQLVSVGFGLAQGTGTNRQPMLFGFRQVSTSDQGNGDAFLRLKSAFAATSTQYQRQYVKGAPVTLTESAATTVVTFDIASGDYGGGVVTYCVYAADASDKQLRCGQVRWQAINVSGTETCNVNGVDNAFTANPDQTQDGSNAGAMSTGTLTYAWSVSTAGTNQCALQLNAVSSLTQTTLVASLQHTLNGLVLVN